MPNEVDTSGAAGGAGSTTTSLPAAGASGAESAPSPISLSDDSLVAIPGQEKPVKYGEYHRGLQAQLTKASQGFSKSRAELEQLRKDLAARDQELNRLRTPATGGAQADPYAAVRALPYLSGEQAAEVISGISAAIDQRDKAIVLMFQQLRKMGDTVAKLSQTHTSGEFNGKIGKWLKELGLPDEASDFAQETYLAYEGDDLDAEFPNILKSRWDNLQSLIRKMDKQKADAAKNKPFVPGRGGQGSPTRPLGQKGHKTAKQIADEVFDQFASAGE